MFPYFWGGLPVNGASGLNYALPIADPEWDLPEEVRAAIEEHQDEISSVIDSKSVAFPEVRLFPADRSVLFIAVAEIIYCDDIPDKVSVSEAANIASRYSSGKSASFISGILSSVIADKQ